MSQSGDRLETSIVPWLSVKDSMKALDFYLAAFNAIAEYRLDLPDGTIVARLSIQGAKFWMAEASPNISHPITAGDVAIRMILTVEDPETLFQHVIRAGATEIYPVSDQHGWKVGRLQDPFGHHWEIGKPLPG